MPPGERRQGARLAISVPVRVQGHDPDGREWEEMSLTSDASWGGASFPLKHAHGVGQVVLLSLPLPRDLRRHALSDTSYRTYGLIRGSRAGGSGAKRVGVMFLGPTPPGGYQENPGGRYLLPGDEPPEPSPAAERRRHQRLQLFVDLTLQRADGSGAEERTVTENISRRGARVLCTLGVVAGERVTVKDPSGRVTARAVVRNVFSGPDRVARLNLEFPEPADVVRLLETAGLPPLGD